jgi:hypothetical protein
MCVMWSERYAYTTLWDSLTLSQKRFFIDRDNGSFLITDRFFRLWIQCAQTP